MLTVACVLKSGGDFDAEYVERLAYGVNRHLSQAYRFVCLSDVPVHFEHIPLKYDLPGWWSKMELFRPDLELGDIFYLDLDTVIVGDLSPLVAMDRPRIMDGRDSSVMSLPKDCRSSVWLEWMKDPAKHMEEYGCDDRRKDPKRSTIYYDLTNIGDQAFIRRTLLPGAHPYGYLFSYHELRLAKPTFAGPKLLSKARKNPLPRSAAVVVFNHKPRPRDVNWLHSMELAI